MDNWITCENGLPKLCKVGSGDLQLSDQVLVTVLFLNNKKVTVDTGFYTNKGWFTDYGEYRDWKVIAWLPMPEPYKGEEYGM